MFVLFLLISILVFIESSTSIARSVGFSVNSPYAGITLQGSLSLVSRFVIFLYSPLLGWLADTKKINLNLVNSIPYLYSLVPISLLAVFVFQNQIASLYGKLLTTSLTHGRWIKQPSKGFRSTIKDITLRPITASFKFNTKLKYFSRVKYIILLLYFPYYAAWPITFLLIASYPDYRATFLSASTVLTALNTIGLTIWLDPLLLKMQNHQRSSVIFLNSLVITRLWSSLLVYLILIPICFF